MNIHDYWPTTPGPIESSVDGWYALLIMRMKTFQGFAKIEARNGLLQPKVSFNSSKGQEMLRILGFRVLEEAAECFAAHEPEHQKEEAVDAINYLLSLPLLDMELFTIKILAETCHESTEGIEKLLLNPELNLVDLGSLTSLIAGDLADTFRNRAWMNQAQDYYFAGGETLLDILRSCLQILLCVFKDFDEFWRYYIAKDQVLQFRLRSKY